MTRRTFLISTTLVLVGLGLGATFFRDQIPVGMAQQVPSASRPTAFDTLTLNENAAKLQNEQNTIDIVSRYEPGLVFISTEQEVVQQDSLDWMFGGGSSQTEVRRGVGSGFFVNSAGDILTNYHVVASDTEAGGKAVGAATRIQIRLMGREESIPAKVIGLAPQYDLALIRPIKIDAKFIQPIPLGNSDTLKVGQKAVAMGAPFGLEFSVTEGIVSSIARQIPIGFSGTNTGEGITQKAIQTDAAINPGNSGGPLLDSKGRVIGINTQIYSPTGQSGSAQSAGVGFAIPINAAKNLLPRLQAAAGGIVSAPKLGINAGLVVQGRNGNDMAVGLSVLTTQGKQELGLPDRGLVVGSVDSNTPAARAGIKGGSQLQRFRGGAISMGGDIILSAEGKTVDAFEDLQAALIDKKVGDNVTLKVIRVGKERSVKVVLDSSAF